MRMLVMRPMKKEMESLPHLNNILWLPGFGWSQLKLRDLEGPGWWSFWQPRESLEIAAASSFQKNKISSSSLCFAKLAQQSTCMLQVESLKYITRYCNANCTFVCFCTSVLCNVFTRWIRLCPIRLLWIWGMSARDTPMPLPVIYDRDN